MKSGQTYRQTQMYRLADRQKGRETHLYIQNGKMVGRENMLGKQIPSCKSARMNGFKIEELL